MVIATVNTTLLAIFAFERKINRFSSVAVIQSCFITFKPFWISLARHKRIVYAQNCMLQLIIGPMSFSLILLFVSFRNTCISVGTISKRNKKYVRMCSILAKIFEKEEEEDETGHAPTMPKIGFTNLVAYFISSSAFVRADIFSMVGRFDETDYVSIVKQIRYIALAYSRIRELIPTREFNFESLFLKRSQRGEICKGQVEIIRENFPGTAWIEMQRWKNIDSRGKATRGQVCITYIYVTSERSSFVNLVLPFIAQSLKKRPLFLNNVMNFVLKCFCKIVCVCGKLKQFQTNVFLLCTKFVRIVNGYYCDRR